MADFRKLPLVLIIVAGLLALVVSRSKQNVDLVNHPLRSLFNSVTELFVEAEDWPMPYLATHIAFLDFILALDTCIGYRRQIKDPKGHPILQVFFSCLIGTFGGTTMTALLLGQPPGWLSSLGSPVAFAMGFWCIFCFPGFINAVWPVEFVMGLINCISGGHGVTSWGADKALSAFHLPGGSGPFALLCGTLSGCGGGILANWLGLTGDKADWSISTPPVLKSASATVKTAALGSISYYLMRNPHSFLPWQKDFIPHQQAKTVVFLLWVGVLILQQIGISDPLRPVFTLFRRLALTPDTVGAVQAPAPAEKTKLS